MTGLDSCYIAAFNLAEEILDKDDGFPLANGLIYFYKDSARSELKSVYELTTAPTYEYVVLPNPIKLSSIGTFQNNAGEDIVPYFYPYDDQGNLELYYVEVYSSLDGITPAVLQFTREAVPSSAITAIEESNELINYIPNGQFFIHTDIPTTSATTEPGQIFSDFIHLAQGGWNFTRSSGSTAVDSIVFNPIYSALTNPSGNPKFTCNVICYVPDVNTGFKGLRMRIGDVNKFASETQLYTISFSAKSNSGNSTIDINLIKNFGTGGSPSPSTTTPIAQSIELSSSFTTYNYSFVFGTNIGKTLGTDLYSNYLEIDFSLPNNSAFNIEITDVSLVMGDLTLTDFPVQTQEDMQGRSIFNYVTPPSPDGSNLYLPSVLTPWGTQFDDSEVGTIIAVAAENIPHNALFCDGTAYDTTLHSAIGIPYRRLFNKIWSNYYVKPIWGTGTQHMTAGHYGGDNISFTMNADGATSSFSDGAVVPTNFTFHNLTVGGSTIGFFASLVDDNIIIESLTLSYPLSLPARGGGLGFTVSLIQAPIDNIIPMLTQVSFGAIAGLESQYFTLATSTDEYYFWITVDGVGVDPAPGGTGVRIDLLSTQTLDNAKLIIINSINAVYSCYITFLAGSAITPGAYFNAYTPFGKHYVIWYEIDGGGTQPVPLPPLPDRFVKVSISSANSALDVGWATMIAVNSMFFAVPDLRGAFLRGYASGSSVDPDRNLRTPAAVGGISGDNVATKQLCEIQSHYHSYTTKLSQLPQTGSSTLCWHNEASANTGNTGGNETRPVNITVKWAIKY